jgi:transposase, IS30 family
MGERYRQLSLSERIEIYRLHAGGKSLRIIGRRLGRSASTIGRELERNSTATKVWPGGYDAGRAHRLAMRRRWADPRFKLVRQPDLRALVKDRLAMGWSPEQIAGRLTLEHGRTVISHESIYRFIYHRTALKDYLHKLLPRRKSKRGRFARRGGSQVDRIRHRRPVAERAQEAADRQTPGHWEADFMLFARHGQSLLVLHERHSRFTLVHRPPNRMAEPTAKAIAKAIEPFEPALRRTISFDNGSEFARHYRLTDQLGIETFFCDPHCPWQKGGIENAIGRLRRTLPTRTDITQSTEHTIRQAIASYNATPRKCLDFKTPDEAFSKLQPTVALQT